MKKITLSDLEDVMNSLEDIQRNFLLQNGWIYTCQSPDCSWYWVKKFGGEQWTGNADTAIELQTAHDLIHGNPR